MTTSFPCTTSQDQKFFTRRSRDLFSEWFDQRIIKISPKDRVQSMIHDYEICKNKEDLVEEFYNQYAILDGREELITACKHKAVDFSQLPPALGDLHSPHELDAMPSLYKAKKNMFLLSQLQETWINYGFIILPGIIKSQLIDDYLELREKLRSKGVDLTGSSFVDYREIRELFCNPELTHHLGLLAGEEISLYIVFAHNLLSTERPWHQDQYLIGDSIYGSSVSAWISLGDVTEEQGPFQFIPGSHRFGILDYSKSSQYLSPEFRIGGEKGAMWSSYTHLITSVAYSRLLNDSKLETYSFTPSKGDVLISHPRLIHRAARPIGKAPRPGIIGQWTTLISGIVDGKTNKDSKDHGLYWN